VQQRCFAHGFVISFSPSVGRDWVLKIFNVQSYAVNLNCFCVARDATNDKNNELLFYITLRINIIYRNVFFLMHVVIIF